MVTGKSPGPPSSGGTAAPFRAGVRLRHRAKIWLLHPQLLLGLKAALAAGLSWSLALIIPGVAAEFPYYAPLGALVAMYPTVAGTAKQGLQTIVGLGLGMALAYLAAWIGGPNPFTIAMVVGVGVLISGTLPRIDGGGQWIPTAGLFVLVLGGANIEDYSLGYFIQMILGVLIGLAISSLVLPPLHLNDAVTRIAGLRRAVARQIQDMGQALEDKWPADDPRWAQKKGELLRAAHGVRETVRYAGESRRGNLRSRFYPTPVDQDYEHVAVLEAVTFHVENVTDLLKDAIWGTANERAVPPAMYKPLEDAFDAIGQVLELWTVNENDDETLAAAHAAMKELGTRIYESVSAEVPFDAASTIAMSLQRILKAVTPLLSTTVDNATSESGQ